MKLYLDNCCFNRPYDDQSEFKVSMETRAKLHVQDEIRSGKHELVGSYMLQYENDKNPNAMRKSAIGLFQNTYCTEYIPFERRDGLAPKIKEIMGYNIAYKDATHAACAIYAECDYLLTTDADFQKRYKGTEIGIINPIEFIRLEKDDGGHRDGLR